MQTLKVANHQPIKAGGIFFNARASFIKANTSDGLWIHLIFRTSQRLYGDIMVIDQAC